MRGYLAGPRTGLHDYNRRAFQEATADLRGRGWKIVSPTELDSPEDGMGSASDGRPLPDATYLDGLRRCIAAMIAEPLDAVIVLDGWEDSRGAEVETTLARGLGVPILRYPLLESVDPEPRVESVLQEAERIVNGARADSYGHPADHSQKVADLWCSAFGWNADAYRVNLAMVLFKVARADVGKSRDSLVDVAGYARTAEAVLARRGREGFTDLDDAPA